MGEISEPRLLQDFKPSEREKTSSPRFVSDRKDWLLYASQAWHLMLRKQTQRAYVLMSCCREDLVSAVREPAVLRD